MSGALLAEMRAYMRRTGMESGRLSWLASGDSRLFGALEAGRIASPKVCDRAFAWMEAHPEPPLKYLMGAHSRPSPPVPVGQLVERDPCPWCAVRGDIGCECLEQRMRWVA